MSKSIDKETIKHVAKLARIGISDDEAQTYAEQTGSVLDYMNILSEVDTEGVEMTMQVTGLNNVLREDKVNNDYNSEELIAVSKLPKISGQIAVRAVIKEE